MFILQVEERTMQLNKENLTLLKNNKNMLKRLVLNGFTPNLYLTLNPHHYNCSPSILLFNFREALIHYYSREDRNFNNNKDKQYPLILFLENGRNRDLDEKNPHPHILIQIPEDKQESFVDFVYDYLYQYYPSLTEYDTTIDMTTQTTDMLNIWMYNDKEQREFDINPLMTANKIFTTSDFQKSIKFNKTNKYKMIEEWYKSEPICTQQSSTSQIADNKITDQQIEVTEEEIAPDNQTSVIHKIYNTAKSIFTAPLNYVGKAVNQCLLHCFYALPVDDYYLYHIHRQLYEDLVDSDDGYG